MFELKNCWELPFLEAALLVRHVDFTLVTRNALGKVPLCFAMETTTAYDPTLFVTST